MKAAFAIAALICATASFGAPPAVVKPQRFSIFGKEYMRIDEWARANSFQWKWASKNDVEVWSKNTRMQFTVDSRKMSLNGITVWLSESVTKQNGLPYVAAIDFRTAIQPVLFPPRNRPRSPIKHICIDPGHGGKQPGNIAGGAQEKRYTLLLGQELGAQLRKAGYTVSFTRTGDTLVDLPVRPDLARRRGADLFLSLHFNSSGEGGKAVDGAEVYCMTPQGASSTNARGEGKTSRAFDGNLSNTKNMLLAYELQKAIVRGVKSEDRGVKRARFAVLCEAEMPAALIEGGFMTNPAEVRNITSVTWRRQLAQAIVAGVASYRKIVEP